MSAAPDMAAPNIASLEAKVAGSSFYAAMKLMPPAERAGMFAIYAFCRAVDDIADDGEGSRADRKKQLDAWRADIDALYAGGDAGQAAFLAEAVRRFGLERADFIDMIDGMQMDADGDIVAPTLAELDLYCDRVASSVGRLSVKVFGMDREPGIALARSLGQALQLTNILRDLDEDAAIGRLYLPREALERAGVPVTTPAAVIAHPNIDAAAREVAALARAHYHDADALMRKRPKGRLTAPRMMEAVYSEILRRTERQGWAAPRTRVSLSKPRKIWLALRSALGG